ncbi:adenosylcobinamide hydrolase [Phaeovulum vinaykumarii]|uniref:Adenosylcobinamide hydrolase n=1 Tax=Phaeovulum vinaykumarii TaxID=407234 RepID=A0A1N7L8W6_9RHOB|nr:adenosylcobinamide hydrolase [Phaeovulum vinaykumarii]SOB99023.1 adenosylcobinamide hydrolase [Phaeovulum vinaykumarii]
MSAPPATGAGRRGAQASDAPPPEVQPPAAGALRLDRPWLDWDLGGAHRVLSFAPHRPGFVTATRLIWREVRNADLPPGRDVDAWLRGALQARGALDAVVMLTARDIACHDLLRVEVEGIAVTCLATVGLTNAESIGRRRVFATDAFGTINIGVRIEADLTAPAQIEALSIAAEARTAAVMAAGLHLETGLATGTGTDCIAVAAQPGAAASGGLAHAGLHTALGEALGAAVHGAVARGVAAWQVENAS